MAKKKTKASKKPVPQHNVWSFLTVCVNRLYNLLKLGHLFSAVIFFVLIYLLVILIKYPADKLPDLVFGIGGFLKNEKFFIFPMSVALGFSIWGNIQQKIVYQREIKRLVNHRKNLVHGLETEELKPLKDHTSSKIGMKEEGLE